MTGKPLATCCSFFYCCVSVLAIDRGESQARFSVGASGLTAEAVFAWEDIDSVLELDLSRNGVLEESEMESASLFLGEYGETLYHLENAAGPLQFSSVTTTWNPEEESIAFHYSVESDKNLDEMSSVRIDFVGIGDLAVGHRQAIELTDAQGSVISRQMVGEPGARALHSVRSDWVVPVSQGPSGVVKSPTAAGTPVEDISRVLYAAGFLLIAMAGSFWFIRRASTA